MRRANSARTRPPSRHAARGLSTTAEPAANVSVTMFLLAGAFGAVSFVVVFTVDGLTRAGYSPAYQTVSALALGPRGWVQTVNFLASGSLITLGGLGAIVEVGWIPGLAVALFGLALVGSGLVAMDPMRGYPPGTPSGDPDEFSRAHELHDWFGMVVFAGLALVPLITGFALSSVGWTVFTWITAAVCLVLAGAFATAWEADAPRTGLVQRLALIVGLGWLAATLIHLTGAL